jgi:hypothetical protein
LNATILNSVTIAASGSVTSPAIMLGDRHLKHSIYYVVTGDGTLKIEYEASPDGENYVTMATAVAELKTKTTGEQSNGIHFDELAMIPCEICRFKFTETVGANSVTVTAILCFRLWD